MTTASSPLAKPRGTGLPSCPPITPAAWICLRRSSAPPRRRARWLPDGQAWVSPKGAFARWRGAGCGYTLHGGGQTAVILEPARPADLSPLILDLHGLTNRERQITQLLLRGLPTADIAQMLFISRHTLGDHMKAIFDKLGVSSRPELTALLLDQVLATT